MAGWWRRLQAEREFKRGQGLAARRRFAEAAQAYRRARELAPDFAAVYLHEALLHAEQENYASAVSALQHALALAPEHPIYTLFLGWMQALGGWEKAAETTFERAAKLAPTNRLVSNGRAFLLLRQGRWREGLALLRERGLGSNLDLLSHLLVEIERRAMELKLEQNTGPPSEISNLKSRAESPPPLSWWRARWLWWLAGRWLDRGRYEKAVQALERLRPRAAQFRQYFLYLGAAYFETHRYEAARRVLEKAEESELRNLYLTATCARLGDYELAGRYVEKIWEGPDADYVRGLLQLAQGRFREARRLFRQALAQDGGLVQRRIEDLARLTP
ncbi:MAG TPA: tetratricopeptide repeat protein [Armatimonadetes bacterium]|nr:tetratricopeptide repeat protein [Armatimonadota bacterium]